MAALVELQITDVAFGGAGVARHGGKVYFVPFTAPGDTVRAEVVKDRRKFAEARALEILTPSPDRVVPECEYFTRCGGCAYQHIAYEKQLELKSRQVEQTLLRVGKFPEVPMRPIVPAPQPYAYRNRIRVHVQDGRAGFFAHRSHELIPIARCAIARPAVNESLRDLRRSPARDGDYTLFARDRHEFFEQTNDEVAAPLLALVEQTVRRNQSLLLDAYAGSGFFSHPLAPLFAQVIGIEENEHAVARARRNAAANERHLLGDVSVLLAEVLAGHAMERTTVILDPPATGLSARVTDLLSAARPSEILCVSCNPATLARDLCALRSVYRLESVTPLDMFPQTAEIEVLAVLRPA
ncbi:MAG: TRAM domain-containing protein [Chthoniobacteraceae bacterium]